MFLEENTEKYLNDQRGRQKFYKHTKNIYLKK